MSKINHHRDILVLIDDKKNERNKPTVQASTSIELPPLLGKNRSSYDAFVVACATAELTGAPWPDVPKRLRRIFAPEWSRHTPKTWLSGRFEYQSALRRLEKQRNRKRKR